MTSGSYDMSTLQVKKTREISQRGGIACRAPFFTFVLTNHTSIRRFVFWALSVACGGVPGQMPALARDLKITPLSGWIASGQPGPGPSTWANEEATPTQ